MRSLTLKVSGLSGANYGLFTKVVLTLNRSYSTNLFYYFIYKALGPSSYMSVKSNYLERTINNPHTHTHIHMKIIGYFLTKYLKPETLRGCPRGVMDCGIVVSEFVFQSRYYRHFRANSLGKDMNPSSSQLWVK